MAYIKVRKDSYYACWLQDGKRICLTTGYKATKKNHADAWKRAQEMEQIAKGNQTVENSVKLIRAVGKRFGKSSDIPTIETFLMQFSVRTSMAAQSNFVTARKRFLAFLGPHKTKLVDWLTVDRCKQFLEQETERVSKGTVRTYKSYLQLAFSAAITEEFIEKNPFSISKLKYSKKGENEREPFTEFEMARLMRELQYPWKHAVFLSYYTGGQRISDICNMRWESVDMKGRTIRIKTQKTKTLLEIPIHDDLMQIMEELSEKRGNTEYVLPELHYKYTASKGAPSTAFTTLMESMGIGRRIIIRTGERRHSFYTKSFHSIRHMTVTELRESGKISMDVAHEIVGHSSELVQRAYSHPRRQKKLEAIEVLANAIKKGQELDAPAP